jgi:exosortase/archaeosortase family protein
VSSQKKKKYQGRPERSLKAEWLPWYEDKRPVLWFALKFGVLVIAFYALLTTTFCDRLLYSYLEANAWVSNAILNAFHQDTRVLGLTIESPDSPQYAITVQRGCDAVEPTWLVCAAVLSFQTSWIRRFLGILAGIIILQALNLVRIVTLYWIGLHWPAFFNTAHMEIWPVTFILIAIILFVYWREWASNQTKANVVA